MALLLPSSLSLFPSPSPSSSSLSPTHQCFPIASANLATRLSLTSISASPLSFQKKTQILTRASSEAPGDGSPLPPLESTEKPVSIENLPRESKQQELDAVKLKFKLARKQRQRRRKLLLKRKLRKLGKWPPSKLKNKDGKKAYKKKKNKKKN